MSGTEPGIAEIVAEVLAEHIWTPRKKGPAECWSADDDAHCGRKFTTGGEYRRHVAQLVAERLQAAEVGACGAAGGEAGTELPACDSGAQKAARELADFLDRNSPTFDGHRIVAVSPKLYAAIKRMPVRTRCDEDSGSYGTCGCPIRCNLDAGHDGEHRAGIGGES